MSDQNLLQFTALVEPVTAMIANAEIDADLESRLNAAFAPSNQTFRSIEHACHDAIQAGWMCSQVSSLHPGRDLVVRLRYHFV